MKNIKKNKKLTIPLLLIAIFLLTLFLTTYFNYTSGIAINPSGTTTETKYLLSGPDPYYNLRICRDTLNTGTYNYLNPYDKDPLLNYPLGGKGVRPPLFNMMAVGATSLLTNFIPEVDAFGLALLFLPAIYGSLMIFPVYHIGKDLFNKKVGIIAALFIPLIPIHIGGSHGALLSLFDHDSFLYLLSAILFSLLIKSFRTTSQQKHYIYSILSGLTLGAIYLTWTAARFFFVILIAYISIQFLIDIIRLDKHTRPYTTIIVTAVTSLMVSFPYMLIREETFAFPLILLLFSSIIFFTKRVDIKLNLPWLISIPSLGAMVSIFITYIYLISIGIFESHLQLTTMLSNMLFGAGIYGSKISTTIAEAKAYNISQTVMSFGIALYWFAILGLVLYIYQSHRDKIKPHNVFFLSLTFIYLWLSTTAGRFVNDLIPFVAILSAYFIFSLLDKIDYKALKTSLKYSHSLKESIKIKHIVGILMIAFLIILPNTYMSLDASVPVNIKQEVFGPEYQGANGLSLGKSAYWADACAWLTTQDTSIKNNINKPAVISWWDYGFYIASMSQHPTVADNFQEGIPPAANFHTAQSEKEAISILTIRLIEGEKQVTTTGDVIVGKINNPKLKATIIEYFPVQYKTLIDILEDPITNAPSYDTLIAESYGNDILRVTAKNAMYHDATAILTILSEDDLISFHKQIETITGHSIRYYATEQYDQQIFSIFPFLADKSTYGQTTDEDDYFKTVFVDDDNIEYSEEQISNMTKTQLQDLNVQPSTKRKSNYYNSLWYNVWNGPQYLSQRIPTFGLRHFYIQYYSPYVIITKYYEGCKLTGQLTIDNTILYNGPTVQLLDEQGITHDADVTQNGTYNIISPPGNNTLLVSFGQEELSQQKLPHITEAEATRSVNYTKDPININFNYSSVNITITNTTTPSILSLQSQHYPSIKQNITVTSNTYTIKTLIPDTYTLTLNNETTSKFLKPNSNNMTIDGGK